MTVWLILAAAGGAATAIAGGASWQGASARADTRAILLRGEAIARDRERMAAMARTLERPPLNAVLTSLRAHLPPGVRLAEASRGEDGGILLAIDTPDPDALRAALAADGLLRRFRERGQEARDDGTIRVRLTGEIG